MIKLGICQIETKISKQRNLENATNMIIKSIEDGCNIIILPECFNSPYGIKYFREYSEYLPLDNNIQDIEEDKIITYKTLQGISNSYKDVYIFAGSIPEIDGDNIYNTCPVFHGGKLINKYRKIHLYEINLLEHVFKESDVITCGNKPVYIETEWGNIGIGICYDLRFPELADYYRKNECFMIIYPGSFNRITGEAHWELLQRARALDNMLYIASCSTSFNPRGEYQSWGHSMIVDPWGRVLNDSYENEYQFNKVIDIKNIKSVRNKIPCLNNKRLIN